MAGQKPPPPKLEEIPAPKSAKPWDPVPDDCHASAWYFDKETEEWVGTYMMRTPTKETENGRTGSTLPKEHGNEHGDDQSSGGGS